jgi:hypothetical protein
MRSVADVVEVRLSIHRYCDGRTRIALNGKIRAVPQVRKSCCNHRNCSSEHDDPYSGSWYLIVKWSSRFVRLTMRLKRSKLHVYLAGTLPLIVPEGTATPVRIPGFCIQVSLPRSQTTQPATCLPPIPNDWNTARQTAALVSSYSGISLFSVAGGS